MNQQKPSDAERIKAERQLLALAMLISNNFIDERNWLIWEAICDMTSLNGSDVSIDLITIRDTLNDNDELEAAGGAPYIAGLVDEIEEFYKQIGGALPEHLEAYREAGLEKK